VAFGKGNVAEARRYIAGLAQFNKPIAQLSDRYVIRVANQFQRQLQAGLPPSLQAARGHAKREKGKAPTRLPAPAHAYQAAHKQFQAHKVAPRRQAHARAQAQPITSRTRFARVTAPDTKKLERAIRRVTKAPGSRVKIAFKDINGFWHTLGQKGGWTLESLLRRLTQAKDVSDFIGNLWRLFYGSDPEELLPDPDDLEIELFNVQLGNA